MKRERAKTSTGAERVRNNIRKKRERQYREVLRRGLASRIKEIRERLGFEGRSAATCSGLTTEEETKLLIWVITLSKAFRLSIYWTPLIEYHLRTGEIDPDLYPPTFYLRKKQDLVTGKDIPTVELLDGFSLHHLKTLAGESVSKHIRKIEESNIFKDPALRRHWAAVDIGETLIGGLASIWLEFETNPTQDTAKKLKIFADTLNIDKSLEYFKKKVEKRIEKLKKRKEREETQMKRYKERGDKINLDAVKILREVEWNPEDDRLWQWFDDIFLAQLEGVYKSLRKELNQREKAGGKRTRII